MGNESSVAFPQPFHRASLCKSVQELCVFQLAMAAILRILLLTLVLCHGVDAKAAKRKKASKPKTSGESSSRTSSYDWGNLMTVVQQVFADWKFDATFESLYNSTVESLYNFTNSSTSTEGGLVEQLVEKLRELWESNLQDRIIAPCD